LRLTPCSVEGFWALVITVLALAGLGIVEMLRHRRALDKIRIRVHVNGTRGKSSVTRLIAAGLRAHGVRTVAKTTGTLARLILPNGRELPVYRPAKPNIIEQLAIVRAASDQKAEALVIECMALQPQLQSLSERKMIRATHGVLTNARPDHLDVMGPSDDDVALALAGSVPKDAKMFTAEVRRLSAIQAAAEDRNSELIAVGPEDVKNVSDDVMSGFSYLEHKENVALALKVLKSLDIPEEVATAGMHAADPDPGALVAIEL
jgi:poly-gamma-glutamate synthase PgsB/CapB